MTKKQPEGRVHLNGQFTAITTEGDIMGHVRGLRVLHSQ